MSKKPLTIIFDSNGNMLDQGYIYVNGFRNGEQSEVAKDFDDRMEYVELREHTRRSTRVYLKSVTSGRKYSMFADDFNKVVLAKMFNDNHIEGTWHFIKSGSGQAIKLVLE